MFTDLQYSGKHLVCDIKNIRNQNLLTNVDNVMKMMDEICKTHEYTILHKVKHVFHPQGFSILYLLSESHMSIHTFPERNYIAFDLYTCKYYENNDAYHTIHKDLIKEFDADYEIPHIIDRHF